MNNIEARLNLWSYCEDENEEANLFWSQCLDDADRINYIRKNPSQFDFADWSDMRKVVRGEYFIGSASELFATVLA